MTFYFDQDYSSRAVEALRHVDAGPIESVRTAFPEQVQRGIRVADLDWLRLIGDRRWLAITRDAHILRRADEFQTLVDHDVGLVILRAPTASAFEMLSFAVRRWEWLHEIDAGQERPFTYVTTLEGEPELIDLAVLGGG